MFLFAHRQLFQLLLQLHLALAQVLNLILQPTDTRGDLHWRPADSPGIQGKPNVDCFLQVVQGLQNIRMTLYKRLAAVSQQSK